MCSEPTEASFWDTLVGDRGKGVDSMISGPASQESSMDQAQSLQKTDQIIGTPHPLTGFLPDLPPIPTSNSLTRALIYLL